MTLKPPPFILLLVIPLITSCGGGGNNQSNGAETKSTYSRFGEEDHRYILTYTDFQDIGRNLARQYLSKSSSDNKVDFSGFGDTRPGGSGAIVRDVFDPRTYVDIVSSELGLILTDGWNTAKVKKELDAYGQCFYVVRSKTPLAIHTKEGLLEALDKAHPFMVREDDNRSIRGARMYELYLNEGLLESLFEIEPNFWLKIFLGTGGAIIGSQINNLFTSRIQDAIAAKFHQYVYDKDKSVLIDKTRVELQLLELLRVGEDLLNGNDLVVHGENRPDASISWIKKVARRLLGDTPIGPHVVINNNKNVPIEELLKNSNWDLNKKVFKQVAASPAFDRCTKSPVACFALMSAWNLGILVASGMAGKAILEKVEDLRGRKVAAKVFAEQLSNLNTLRLSISIPPDRFLKMSEALYHLYKREKRRKYWPLSPKCPSPEKLKKLYFDPGLNYLIR